MYLLIIIKYGTHVLTTDFSINLNESQLPQSATPLTPLTDLLRVLLSIVVHFNGVLPSLWPWGAFVY